ncbi:hypothetical protein UFOVP610_35 [uncultured Caudovirales phage]|uniref:Uncharacterized protein n=1 Tax=uncultured Caudovirales phage TaxID=2100421 RepID=A0A6J5N2M0_9CAUD|nr:hypothetical protein UFOVP610_35 [uncultured Caudovirales phage]
MTNKTLGTIPKSSEEARKILERYKNPELEKILNQNQKEFDELMCKTFIDPVLDKISEVLKKDGIMTENCKHEPMNYFDLSGTKHIDAVPKKSKCTFCGAELVATWTVKQEPLKFEFEAEFSFDKDKYILMYNTNLTSIGKEDLCESGKRFKITAEEIIND